MRVIFLPLVQWSFTEAVHLRYKQLSPKIYILIKYKTKSDRERPFFSPHDCYGPAALALASFKIGRMFRRRKVMIGFLSGLNPDWECRHYRFGGHSALTYISTLILRLPMGNCHKSMYVFIKRTLQISLPLLFQWERRGVIAVGEERPRRLFIHW